MKKKIMMLIGLVGMGLSAQKAPVPEDALQLRKFYDAALLTGKSHAWLSHLSLQIGGRLSGSVNAQRAIDWAQKELKKMPLDKVWLQPTKVTKWSRGVPEYAYIETSPGQTTTVPICALGGAVPTPDAGLKASVVEVKSFEELAACGHEQLAGKIVFYNRPMQASLIDPFEAYKACVDYRDFGAKEAAKYGAVGIIVRSLNLRMDDFPHTGPLQYGTTKADDKIPAAAISTNGADLLSSMLALNPELKFHYNMSCRIWKAAATYNVIGEITGTTYPESYLVVAGHLNAWDLGDGSLIDGAGAVQAMEVLRLFQETGYRPKHSIRIVLSMNGVNELEGVKTYAAHAQARRETHIFALENARGGFGPRGFGFDCEAERFEKIKTWKTLFEPYMGHYFTRSKNDPTLSSLQGLTEISAGLLTDSQRYFDHHQSKNDTFDQVNKRELALGAAAMASLMYLVDSHFF